MTIEEALGRAWPEMDIKLDVYVEHGQQVTDFPVHELTKALAPIIERALRVAYVKGGQDQLESGFGDGLFNPDKGVTAGVAAMVEES